MKPEKGWKRKFYTVIFEAETPWGRRFDIVLLWAIILSVLSVILESDETINLKYGTHLKYIEWFFTIVFTGEYLVRIVSVKRPTQYVFSFFGIIDFLAVAPTYLSVFVAGSQYLLVIRAIRLLRVFRILKLVRYLQESQLLIQALKASRIKITVFLGAVLTLVLIMGTLMHLVEAGNPGFASIFKSMYWAIVTMTTVGYGDVVPYTAIGKFLASMIMIMGYGIIAVPTGIVTSELANVSRQSSTLIPHCRSCNSLLIPREAKYCHHCGVQVDMGE